MLSVSGFERRVGFLTEQQITVRPDNAPQFVDDGTNVWLGNVLEDGEDESEIEGRLVGGEALQAFDRTEIDRRLQRLRDRQESLLPFESDDSLGELGQDWRQASESAADITRGRDRRPDSETGAQLTDVTLLEIRAQHRARTIDVDHFTRRPD